jgi:predicted ArsR family transcriptional regulator
LYPGSKAGCGPSQEAADAISPIAKCLRSLVLQAIVAGPGTADEIAARLGLSLLSVRPRCAELKRLGLIQATGERRRNQSGAAATVWRGTGHAS